MALSGMFHQMSDLYRGILLSLTDQWLGSEYDIGSAPKDDRSAPYIRGYNLGVKGGGVYWLLFVR